MLNPHPPMSIKFSSFSFSNNVIKSWFFLTDRNSIAKCGFSRVSPIFNQNTEKLLIEPEWMLYKMSRFLPNIFWICYHKRCKLSVCTNFFCFTQICMFSINFIRTRESNQTRVILVFTAGNGSNFENKISQNDEFSIEKYKVFNISVDSDVFDLVLLHSKHQNVEFHTIFDVQ